MCEASLGKTLQPPKGGQMLPAGCTLSEAGMLYKGVPVRDMIALPVHVAAILIGRSRWTVWRAIASGKLKVQGRTVLRSELERWLSGLEAPKRRGRPRKTLTPATP